jgi:AraC family transcriptional regulator
VNGDARFGNGAKWLVADHRGSRTPQLLAVHVPGFELRLGVHPGGSNIARHYHDNPTICYVLRGGFTEYSRGEAALCGIATLKVMPAGEPHSNRFGDAETRGLRIEVDRDRFGEEPAIHRALEERWHTSGGRGAELAQRMVAELTAADTAGPIAAEGLALELLVELARTGVRREASAPAWLKAAEERIREGYRTAISVGEIAREVGVNAATLARAYRRHFGCTVGDRIRALRVRQAARELAETAEPLSEIALRAGFYDQSHFTNVFRRTLGVTPSAYRAGLQ